MSLFTIVIVNTCFSFSVFAQQNGVWSTPEIIFQTEGSLSTTSMALVADPAGQLHLFFPHQPDQSLAYSIDYMVWDGAVWSEPIDILIDPYGDSIFIKAATDFENNIHLIWIGRGIRHASAPLVQAGIAKAWSKPQTIGNALGEPGFVVDSNGVLYVLYTNADSIGALSLVSSTDGGNSWSFPVSVAFSPAGNVPKETSLAVDSAGRLHAAWTEYELPNGWPPTGVLYTRSVDGGQNWESPQQMIDGLYGQVAVATVGQDDIHLVWRSTAEKSDGTFHQWSGDGGQTWQPQNHDPHGGGFSGLPSFAIDSVSRFHFVLGNVEVGTWQNGILSALVDVAGIARSFAEGDDVYSVERGTLTITTGNRLHVVFETNFNTLWHTSLLTDAPLIPVIALPTFEPSTSMLRPTEIPTPIPLPTVSPTDVVNSRDGGDVSEIKSTDPAQAIYLGILPVVVIVAVVILLVQFKRLGS